MKWVGVIKEVKGRDDQDKRCLTRSGERMAIRKTGKCL